MPVIISTIRSLVVVFLILSFYDSMAQTTPPNIVLIITDDQGYGDLGYNGNPHVKTPVLDNFARESVRFNQFYVSPVCAPTRSSLMTGRFSLRTGVSDTYNGGAMMSTDEVTIAEMLKEANYATGVFGKWHLGDSYPSRPNDQGFDRSVIHLSGGMGQVGDFTTWFEGDSSYFDPVLWEDGERKSFEGYCSDIFTNEALSFIEDQSRNPFFCYLSFNAPHTPLQVPSEYYDMYKDIDPASGFDGDDRPFPEMTEKDKEDARKVYAMVSNIDDNVGRVLAKLEELGLKENTMVVFMTDNGPQQRRYVAGMRGRKGFVYRGGTRVPFYVRYPSRVSGNRDIEALSAHIDVLPTLAEICRTPTPDTKIDGRSLVPILLNQNEEWPTRTLFHYWTRRYPEKYGNMAVQRDQYKLVGFTDYQASVDDFELFDLSSDPYEQNNIVTEKPELASQLKDEMDRIYGELILSPHLVDAPRIIVGSEHENPTFLNRNDAAGERGIWAQEEKYGFWRVQIASGKYDIRFKFIEEVSPGGQMFLEAGTSVTSLKISQSTDMIEMPGVQLPEIQCDLTPFYMVDGRRIMPFWVEMERVD